MHYDQGYFDLNVGHSESMHFDNILEKGVLEWIFQHRVYTSITLSSTHYYHHHIIVSITSLPACQHHVSASITSLSSSHHYQHHCQYLIEIIVSFMQLSESHHCEHQVSVSITLLSASCNCQPGVFASII